MNLTAPFPVAARWSKIIDLVEAALLVVFALSLFLLPPVQIVTWFPSVYASDVLLPLMGLCVFIRQGWKVKPHVYLQLLLVYAGYILFTIVINNRLTFVRDYYEVLKVLKLALVVLFVSIAAGRVDLMRVMKITFGLVLLFNVFQYINVGGFNQLIEPFYATSIQLASFGFNSAGMQDTRRMLGTMGNPNDNGILFLFFFVFFIPGRDSSKLRHALFLTAMLGCLFSQSRTGMIALVVVYVAAVVLMRYNWKTVAIHLTAFIALYFTFVTVDSADLPAYAHNLQSSTGVTKEHGQYLGSLMDESVVETNSVQGRLKVWGVLLDMVKQKPLWGHGPSKEFFYEQRLFADGEYMLMLWRYGIVGFCIYLASFLLPTVRAFHSRSGLNSKRMILFALVVAITAITNAPMNNPNVLMMFALFAGLFLHEESLIVTTLKEQKRVKQVPRRRELQPAFEFKRASVPEVEEQPA